MPFSTQPWPLSFGICDILVWSSFTFRFMYHLAVLSRSHDVWLTRVDSCTTLMTCRARACLRGRVLKSQRTRSCNVRLHRLFVSRRAGTGLTLCQSWRRCQLGNSATPAHAQMSMYSAAKGRVWSRLSGSESVCLVCRQRLLRFLQRSLQHQRAAMLHCSSP